MKLYEITSEINPAINEEGRAVFSESIKCEQVFDGGKLKYFERNQISDVVWENGIYLIRAKSKREAIKRFDADSRYDKWAIDQAYKEANIDD